MLAVTGLMFSGMALCPYYTSQAFAEIKPSKIESNEKAVSKGIGSPVSEPVLQEPQEQIEKNEVLDLKALEVIYDEKNQIITAQGEVELIYQGRILRANTVQYNLKTDTASAQGEVALVQPDGQVHFAKNFEFQNKLKEGFVDSLYSYLAEGARLTADKGEQVDGGTRVIMQNATYTPCIPCQKDENTSLREQLMTKRTPAWQIKADKITHDKEEKQIIYKNAQFDFQGIPILYTPYFAHPDGSIDQKSGLLSPSIGFDSDLGANVTSRYYWAIDKDKDATFGLMVPTNEAPVVLAEYRQRFQNASISFSGSLTRSDRTDEVNGVEIKRDTSTRGHIFGKGIWDINRNWRAGFDLRKSSDDQFLRQYNISGEDVLESEVYAERFENRDYLAVRGFGFQDMRIRADDINQPNIIPEVLLSKTGDPGSVLGGRLDVQASFLGLQREGEGRDLTRAILEGGWRRRTVFPLGFVMDTKARVRGDLFNVRDAKQVAGNPLLSDTQTGQRAFARLHNVFRYPLVNSFDNKQIVIEPIAALTLSPDINQKDDEIPNEDSQDIQLDVSTVFNPDRFPGKDRIEDQSRVTYGVNSGLYFDNGSSARFFIGQSYAFENDETLFPKGSGLSQQDSDVVGSASFTYKNLADMDYRFQFDNENLQSQRHELTSFLRYGRASLNTRYFYSRGLEQTSVSETREQLRMSSGLWLDNNRQWQGSSGFTHDFAEDQGLRRAFLGLSFTNECRCWDASFTAVRNLTIEASGESSTEFLIQIGFENLGAFGNTNLR